MPILPIVRLGHPALRIPARPMRPEHLADPSIQQLIDDMFETMREARGVGLAAPQVALGLQLFVYSPPLPEGTVEGTERQLHAVINPLLTPETGEPIYDWEGCLSIPDLRGLVPRHRAVRVTGLDRAGLPLDYVASGFEARIIQHEFDHLNGIVFLDRMSDLISLAFGAEWEAFLANEPEDGEEEEEPAAG
jgi:peptide deformylase